MDQSKKAEYSKLLLSLVPETGVNVGNVTLREQLTKAVQPDTLTEDDYWLLRNDLIDQGLIEQGRGRGGSVHKIVQTPVSPQEAGEAVPDAAVVESTPRSSEADLYDPFHSAIRAGYVKENRIKRFISEITASQGRRNTGGKWTRPDLTVIAVRTYKYTPGKRVEVITFEVKPSLDGAVEGVYEALAHSAFAHRSYLAVDISGQDQSKGLPDERIIQECTRHGVGYLRFENVGDYDTYEIVCPAALKEPDPYDVDNFVRTQVSLEKQEELSEFLQ